MIHIDIYTRYKAKEKLCEIFAVFVTHCGDSLVNGRGDPGEISDSNRYGTQIG
jgi:hypothetical protein